MNSGGFLTATAQKPSTNSLRPRRHALTACPAFYAGPMDDLADLIGRGMLIPASDPAPLALPVGDPDQSMNSTDVISDLREERL